MRKLLPKFSKFEHTRKFEEEKFVVNKIKIFAFESEGERDWMQRDCRATGCRATGCTEHERQVRGTRGVARGRVQNTHLVK